MRAKHKTGFLLALVMMCILCFSVVPVWAEPQGTDGTELQVAQPEQLEIQLGAEWAGVEFQMKTDAGLYPGTIPVGQDGVLRLEIGGSKSYVLTCMVERNGVGMTVPEGCQYVLGDNVDNFVMSYTVCVYIIQYKTERR